MDQTIIAVDIGGTQIRAARYDFDATLQARAQKLTPHLGKQVVLDRLYETIEEVMPADPNQVVGIGAIAPGPINPFTGLLIEAPNIPGWSNVPLRDLLAKHFGRPAYIGNDANLAGLAEYRFGAGRGHKNMIYLTISTGIGSGFIIDGRILLGAEGFAAEAGHMLIDPNGPVCGCGKPGHLEAMASGTAIGRDARERLRDGASSRILELAGGKIDKVDARAVGEAAKAGDSLAIELLAHAAEFLGMGIASLLHLFNPTRIVMGGGVTQTGDLLFGPVRAAVPKYVMSPVYVQNLAIVPAGLGGDVGLLGGLALVLDHL